VKPIPNLEQKLVDFEFLKGKKGKESTIKTDAGEYDPSVYNTISRGVGKCPNCDTVIENSVIMQAAKKGLGYQLYAVAYKQGQGSLEFRSPTQNDISGIEKVENYFDKNIQSLQHQNLIPIELIPEGKDLDEQIRIFCPTWKDMFNPRQLLTLVTYVEIINEAKALLQAEYELEKVEAIITYLALV
jgi:adenine-specific DNA methylase